jgi:hypothetical protein
MTPKAAEGANSNAVATLGAPNLVRVYVVGFGVCGPTLFVHDPHAPGFPFSVALGCVPDLDRVDNPVNPAAVEDGAPALRTVGNRQVVGHGAPA